MRIAAALTAALLWVPISGCVAEDGELDLGEDEAAAYAVRGFTTSITARLPPIVSWGGPYCAANEELSSLSVDVCLEPIEYACTQYFCTDPATGAQRPAPMRSGVNPSCQQKSMQTSACSNSVELAERALPTPKQLHEMMPRWFDKRWASAPLLPKAK